MFSPMIILFYWYLDGLVLDCSISSVLVMEIVQSRSDWVVYYGSFCVLILVIYWWQVRQ